MNEHEPEVDVASDVDDDDDFEDSTESIEEDLPNQDDFNDTIVIEDVLTGEEWLTSNFMLSNDEAMQ